MMTTIAADKAEVLTRAQKVAGEVCCQASGEVPIPTKRQRSVGSWGGSAGGVMICTLRCEK